MGAGHTEWEMNALAVSSLLSPHLQLAVPGMPVAFGRAAPGCYCWMPALRTVWEGELPYFHLQPACTGCPDALHFLV